MRRLKMVMLGIVGLVIGICTPVWVLGSLERDWSIGPSSVGDVVVGRPVPLFVLGMGPELFSSYYGDQIPYLGLRLEQVSISLEYFIIVRGIIPEPELRTAEGTGVGSTLSELEQAHGSLELFDIPEPFRCAVTTPTLPDVYFEFTDCDAARAGEVVVRVNLWRRIGDF